MIERLTRCGRAHCRCRANPAVLRGPHHRWTRKVNNKTVTRLLSDDSSRTTDPGSTTSVACTLRSQCSRPTTSRSPDTNPLGPLPGKALGVRTPGLARGLAQKRQEEPGSGPEVKTPPALLLAEGSRRSGRSVLTLCARLVHESLGGRR
ncbi:MAG: DUF6788 family protein [Acidimicrobiales bacterium]